RPVLMSSSVVPPIRGVKNELLSAKDPWQEAQVDSQSSSPSSTVPCPFGRPLKSGRTSMSQASTSVSVAARPSPYSDWAAAGSVNNAPASPTPTAIAVRLLHVNIANLPAFGNFPGLNGVVVIDRT